jgi:hypothetical protein
MANKKTERGCAYCRKRIKKKPYAISFGEGLQMLFFCSEDHANMWLFCKLPKEIRKESIQSLLKKLGIELEKR